MNWLLPISILIFFELVADIFSEEWSIRNKPMLWIFAIACYLIANVFWLYALRNGSGLARGAIIFSVASAILATVIGLVLYNETLSKIQILGVIVGIVSIFLIMWE